MADRAAMKPWVVDALKKLGGNARVFDVSMEIWDTYESDIRSSGSLLYTWQYDVRWAAQQLQDEGKLLKNKKTKKWELL